MDIMKNQKAPTVILCTRPNPTFEDKEDFSSVKFRDSPIIVTGIYNLGDDHIHQNMDSTQPLVWCNDEKNKGNVCSGCSFSLDDTTEYYLLCKDFGLPRIYNICFHKECIKPITKHPYHPKHSLQVLHIRFVSLNNVCCCCNSYHQFFYYCSICNFIICCDCVTQPVLLLTIDHKKRHEHTLSYLPRKVSMTCDVCALDDRRFFVYVCHQCDFVVHKECIYSPCVIKISRHEHRLSFTSSFPLREWFCGVCRKRVDENYGGYSCVKGCYYVAHSRCALHQNVCDGKELEEEPEEIYEDIPPYKEIIDGTIQHFSHKHHMRLHKEIDEMIEDDNIRCQACALPVYNGDIFKCMECNFVLHNICAHLPLKKQHAKHLHPLVLRADNIQNKLCCSACNRNCNNFMYMCEMANCGFRLDVNCAAVSEPLSHHCHSHILFLPSKLGSIRTCSICKRETGNRLDCGECDFVLCYCCATLPITFRYKYDDHPLIFSYKQDMIGQLWCEVCEEEIDPKYGFYMCNKCDIELHVECLFGRDMYLLPGKANIIFISRKTECDIIPNNRISRYICKRCNQRCQDKIVYKISEEAVCCDTKCLYMFLRNEKNHI